MVGFLPGTSLHLRGVRRRGSHPLTRRQRLPANVSAATALPHCAQRKAKQRRTISKQQTYLNFVAQFDGIKGLKRKRITGYLNGFFDTVTSAKKLKSKILNKCR